MLFSGGVTVSPSGLVSVCHGDQLQLTCTTTGNFLEWKITPRLDESSYPRLLTTTSQGRSQDFRKGGAI